MGGSSLYGSGRPRADTLHWEKPLRTLGPTDTVAHIVPFALGSYVLLGH